MPLILLKIFLVHLRRGLIVFNLNQCRKEQGNYSIDGNFLDQRAPLMENLLSKKEARLQGRNSQVGIFRKTFAKLH